MRRQRLNLLRNDLHVSFSFHFFHPRIETCEYFRCLLGDPSMGRVKGQGKRVFERNIAPKAWFIAFSLRKTKTGGGGEVVHRVIPVFVLGARVRIRHGERYTAIITCHWKIWPHPSLQQKEKHSHTSFQLGGRYYSLTLDLWNSTKPDVWTTASVAIQNAYISALFTKTYSEFRWVLKKYIF